MRLVHVAVSWNEDFFVCGWEKLPPLKAGPVAVFLRQDANATTLPLPAGGLISQTTGRAWRTVWACGPTVLAMVLLLVNGLTMTAPNLNRE